LLRAIAADPAFAAAETTTRYLEERAAPLAASIAARDDDAVARTAAALAAAGYAWRAGGIGIPVVLERAGRRWSVTVTRTPDGFRVRGDAHADITGTPDADPEFTPAPPPSARAESGAGTHGSGDVTAPMPGKIVAVAAHAGASVAAGDPLIVLEAMKMEHRIGAPVAGVIAAVHVAAGDVVAGGAPLVTIGDA
jgi:3-methylcrotonyl-CoA carboxylase alpha subunit